MNTIASHLRPSTTPSIKMRWWCSLLAPILILPLWCLLGRDLASPLATASGGVLLLLLSASTVTDLAWRRIYNWTTYAAAVWAIGINVAAELFDAPAQLGAIGLMPSLAGFTCCFAVMLIAYTLARGGAGDVKLAAAIGALVGVERGLLAIAISYILAGGLVMAWSIWTHGPWRLLVAMGRLLGSMVLPVWIQPPDATEKILLSKPIPLAGFFAAGTLIVMLELI